jgi:hypothetical protein
VPQRTELRHQKKSSISRTGIFSKRKTQVNTLLSLVVDVFVVDVAVVDVAVDVVLVPKLKNQKICFSSMWLIFKKNLVHYLLKL